VNELLRVPDRLYAGYVFDLDGTIYLGSELLPGPKRLLQALPGMRRKVVFVSNNPTRASEEYAGKLSDLGVPAHPSEVINTVVTTTEWLAANAPEATIFPVGEEPTGLTTCSTASNAWCPRSTGRSWGGEPT